MDWRQFAKWGEDLDREFQGTSDRAAAIVGAAMLDAQLRILFEAKIIQDANTSQLFDGVNSPLHSLSGKTDLALALGMISPREQRNLTLIRKIRNEFAHQIGDLSFETQRVLNRCNELEVPIGMRLPTQIPTQLLQDESDPSELPPIPFSTARERFQAAVSYVSSCFHGRLIELMETRVEVRPEFQRYSKVWEVQISRASKVTTEIKEAQTQIKELSTQCAQFEELIKEGKANDAIQRKVLESRKRIEELQDGLRAQQNSDAHDFLVKTESINDHLLRFVRRWETWVEATAEST